MIAAIAENDEPCVLTPKCTKDENVPLVALEFDERGLPHQRTDSDRSSGWQLLSCGGDDVKRLQQRLIRDPAAEQLPLAFCEFGARAYKCLQPPLLANDSPPLVDPETCRDQRHQNQQRPQAILEPSELGPGCDGSGFCYGHTSLFAVTKRIYSSPQGMPPQSEDGLGCDELQHVSSSETASRRGNRRHRPSRATP